MRMQRRYAGIGTLLAVTMLISACTPGSSGSPAGSAGGGTGTPIDQGAGLCRTVGDLKGAQPTPPAASGTSDAKIGVVTDVGTLDDKNFNEYSYLGAKQGAAAVGAAEPRAIVTQNSADYAKNIQTLVDDDFDLIVTVGFAIGAATLKAAKDNPKVHFIGVDQFQAGDDPVAGAGLDNYESLVFSEQQAGYLAGIVAASITKSKHIAAIGGSGTIPPVVNYMRGYENGAHSVDESVKVDLKYVSNDLSVAFNDPTTGKSFSDQFLSQNDDVDVMFQVAGKTGNGILQSVEEAGIYGIGVDVDQWQSTPDQAECIVTSAEKHLTTGVQEGVIAFAGGSARKGNVFYGADNNGIGVAPYYQFDGNVITDDIKAKVQDAYDGMASGDIDPCQPTNLCYAGKEDKGT
ncbi:MAG TPA: BMP family ABC transporter substrate-binding protein [Candidatus Limnocylindria bacterium]|jgi:basic membrane protein A|nr:BMP family ABC transporter substrate-binding protein [Candidatus Limnocylindria bacterium]